MNMGLVYTKLYLSNPKNNRVRTIEVTALVDTGAMHLCIPPAVAKRLKLEEDDSRQIATADGKIHHCPYVGPVKVEFDNRSCFTGAIVLGDEVLLGAVPMEDMDIIVHPLKRKVVVNPESPDIARSIAKCGV